MKVIKDNYQHYRSFTTIEAECPSCESILELTEQDVLFQERKLVTYSTFYQQSYATYASVFAWKCPCCNAINSILRHIEEKDLTAGD